MLFKISSFPPNNPQKTFNNKVPFYEHLGKITYNDRKNQNWYPSELPNSQLA